MRTDDLIVFFAVADFRSFNKAAASLFLSRQTLLRNIDALETQLNKKLFTRSSTGVELTDFGKYFYSEAKPALEKLKSLEALPHEYDRLKKNHFTFGVRGNFGSAYAVKKIAGDFERSHPETTIEIIILENNEIESLIVDEKIDFAYSIVPTTLKGITTEKLKSIEHCLLVSRSHPFAKCDSVSPDMLAGYDYMVRSFSHHTARLFTDYASKSGADVNIVFTTVDLNLVISAAQRDNIVGITIKRDAAYLEALYDDIIVRPFNPPLVLEYGLMYKTNRRFSKLQKQFIEYFRHHFTGIEYVPTQLLE